MTDEEIPADLRYHREHHWIRIDGAIGVVGITDYAQHKLGDIIYVGLPAVNSTVQADGYICEVESAKTSSDIYSPVTGEVVEINTELRDHPDLINADPYGAGWIFKIRGDDLGVERLLNADEYRALVVDES